MSRIAAFRDLPDIKTIDWGPRPDGCGSFSRRFTIVDTPEWLAKVHFENPAPGMVMPMFHLEVRGLTPSVLRQMLATWAEFRTRNPQAMWTSADSDMPALDRLRERFGFQMQINQICSDGIARKLYFLPPLNLAPLHK